MSFGSNICLFPGLILPFCMGGALACPCPAQAVSSPSSAPPAPCSLCLSSSPVPTQRPDYLTAQGSAVQQGTIPAGPPSPEGQCCTLMCQDLHAACLRGQPLPQSAACSPPGALDFSKAGFPNGFGVAPPLPPLRTCYLSALTSQPHACLEAHWPGPWPSGSHSALRPVHPASQPGSYQAAPRRQLPTLCQRGPSCRHASDAPSLCHCPYLWVPIT